MEDALKQGPTILGWEVKGDGVGGKKDAKPADDNFEMWGLFVLISDDSGCPKGSEEGGWVDGVGPIGCKGKPAEHNAWHRF